MGLINMINILNYILVWQCHRGHFQSSCSLWPVTVQLLRIWTSTSKQVLYFSQPIPKVKVGYLHRLGSVIYCYVCVPVPPMPPEVPTWNPAVPVCHMAQELYVMVELCVLLFMWWPRGCGWISRLSLQSTECPCSLRLYCICKGFTKY